MQTSERDLDGNPGNRVQSWDKDGFNIQLGTCTKSDFLVSRVSFHANAIRGPLPDEFTARVQAQMENVDLILFDDGNPARIDQVSLLSPTLYEKSLEKGPPGQIKSYGVSIYFVPGTPDVDRMLITYDTTCPELL